MSDPRAGSETGSRGLSTRAEREGWPWRRAGAGGLEKAWLVGRWTLKLETSLEGQGILDRRKGSLVSRGHSLGRDLEARRYGRW